MVVTGKRKRFVYRIAMDIQLHRRTGNATHQHRHLVGALLDIGRD